MHTLTRIFSILALGSLLAGCGPVFGREDCLACHAVAGSGGVSPEGKGAPVDPRVLKSSVHKDLDCSDCHSGARKRPHTAKTVTVSCLTCHAKPSKELAATAHLALGHPTDARTCVACHGGHGVERPSERGAALCASCHATVVKQFAASIHGRMRALGTVEAPGCKECHGPAHQVVASTDPRSPVERSKLPQTCGHCHSNPALAAKFMFTIIKPVEAYELSVHGRAMRNGNPSAAICNDCHGIHDIRAPTDPESKVSRSKVALTCAKCHARVYDDYKVSIHGRASAAGVDAAPTCVDCHGEHSILAHLDPKSPVYSANIAQRTCSRCHEDQSLNQRFALPGGRLASYQSSYHGLAAKAGSRTVANCASCHGVHRILPSSDPRSTIARANLPVTCGQCHLNVGKEFETTPIHAIPASPVENPWIYAVRLFYLILIPSTVGLMLLHNGLDWLRKVRRHLARYRAPSAHLRLTLHERLQHAILLVSFITLVVTGFALKFPDSFWARPIVALEADFPMRGLLHRISAIVMIAAAVYHILYILLTAAGRAWLLAMLPRARDVRDALATVGHNLGLRPSLPVYPKFNYAEKIEYWAMVWGTALMVTTGILLWAHNTVLEYFSNLVIDLSMAIHYYEAILATLAIVVWHFYAVIFDPDVYPVKWTFVSGRDPAQDERDHNEG